MNTSKTADFSASPGKGDGRSLFLIGMMGAGKTTVGQCAGRLLGTTFIDADRELERRTGKTIEVLFGEGEASFRRLEAALLDELARCADVVLATGGGAILNSKSRESLRMHGYVVYLHAHPEQLWHRTRVQRGRPLLQVDNPLRILMDLYVHRDPLYRECADMVVETGDSAPETLAGVIAAKLRCVAGQMLDPDACERILARAGQHGTNGRLGGDHLPAETRGYGMLRRGAADERN